MCEKHEVLTALRVARGAGTWSTCRKSIFSAIALFASLLILHPAGADAAAPICVVKLKVSSNQSSDGGTKTYVTQILTGEGYKIISDDLLTTLRADDYDVQITLNYTVTPNYGFPVTLMTMQLFIADSSGKVLVEDYIDRANLEDDLRNTIPACNAAK